MKAEYRSAARSRRLIREALIGLAAEKDVDKITVSDIVKSAGINRSTFYAHYPDVWGLIEAIANEDAMKVADMINETGYIGVFGPPKPFLLAVNHAFEENRVLYDALLKGGHTVLLAENLKKEIVQRYIATAKLPEEIRDSLAFRVRLYFFLGAGIEVYQQWLRGNLQGSLEDVLEELSTLRVESDKNLFGVK